MKYIFIEQVGTVYWLENDILMFAPVSNDNTFDTSEGGAVEEELVGSEELPEPFWSDTTFAELYKRVRWILNGKIIPKI